MTTQTDTDSGAAFAFDVSPDGVAHVRFTQGPRGNPFDEAMTTQFARIAADCIRRPEIRALLFSAEGRFFSVGGDLRTLGSSLDGLQEFIENGTAGLHSGISRFARCNAPSVAAVHAMAAGGGVSLLAMCDFVIAARSSKFYAAYQGIGLAIDGGGSYFLPRRVGTRRAAAFYMRNQMWTAEQALEYGLITEIVEDGEEHEAAAALAAELAKGPTRSYGEVKSLLNSSFDNTLEGQMELEARAMARTVRTEDCWNAITTVAAKGRPEFHGR